MCRVFREDDFAPGLVRVRGILQMTKSSFWLQDISIESMIVYFCLHLIPQPEETVVSFSRGTDRVHMIRDYANHLLQQRRAFWEVNWWAEEDFHLWAPKPV